MARFVTTTLNQTKGKVFTVSKDNLEIKSEYISFYGSYTLDAFEKACERAYRGNAFKVFIKAEDLTEDSKRLKMTEEAFIEKGFILKEGDSKLGLITRTISSYMVTVHYVNPVAMAFDTMKVSVKSLADPAKVTKECQKAVSALGYAFIKLDESEPEIISNVYAMTKDDFAKYGEVMTEDEEMEEGDE